MNNDLCGLCIIFRKYLLPTNNNGNFEDLSISVEGSGTVLLSGFNSELLEVKGVPALEIAAHGAEKLVHVKQ